jgi:hypothetical protein
MSDSCSSQAVQETGVAAACAGPSVMSNSHTLAACPEAEVASHASSMQLQASSQRSETGVKVVSGSEQLPPGSVNSAQQLSSPAAGSRVDQAQQGADYGLHRLKIVGIPAGAHRSRYDTAGQDQHQLDRPTRSCWLYLLPGDAGYSEEQLRTLFQLCGSVAESRIVHDKQSGRPVG